MDDEGPAVADLPTDPFYRGTIMKLRRGAQAGIVRSASGKDIPFVFLHVTMLGPRQRFEELREGMSIGYDVSWTSKGLRVCTIRIPD